MCRDSYCVIEAILKCLTPLRWCEDSGSLYLDVDSLREDGVRYARLCLTLAITFLCVVVLLIDLLFASSALAKLATIVVGAAGLVSLAASVAITAQVLKHR